MNSLLLQLPEFLQKQNFGDDTQGLLKGNTGMAIFLYHFSRAIKNQETNKMADALLDKIFSGIAITSPSDLENGLAGIGWGIEYLVQYGFVEGDTNEILDEVDTKVYKALTHENLNSFEMTNGLTGYLLYLNARLKSNNDSRLMAYRINKELLIYTINKIDELVTNQFPNIVKEQYFDLFWRFPVMLWVLTESYCLNIYNRKIEQMIKQWDMYFEAYIPSLHINRLYMALVLSRLNKIFQYQRLERQIQILLFTTNFDEMATEFDPNHNGIRHGWPGALWLLHQASKMIPPDYPNYSVMIQTYKKLKTKINELNDKPLLDYTLPMSLQDKGISSGIAGIGLMNLLWPEIFDNQ